MWQLLQFLGYIHFDLISITENLFEYTGGAHGNYASIGQNFILHPTFTIDLHSLVNYDELDKVLKFISKYCIDDLKEQYKDELGENFKNGDDVFFEGSLDPILENFDNFLLNKNSIDFLFNPYQILPYAYGASVVSIPYDAFKKQIKNQEKINFVLSKL